MSRKSGYTYVSKNRVERPVFYKAKSVPGPQSPPFSAPPDGMKRFVDVEAGKLKALAPPTPPTPPSDPSPPPPSITPPSQAPLSNGDPNETPTTSTNTTPSATPPPPARTISPPPQYHSSADAYSHGKLPLEPPWTKNVLSFGRPMPDGSPTTPSDERPHDPRVLVPWLPQQPAKKTNTLKKGHSFFGFGRRNSTDSTHTI